MNKFIQNDDKNTKLDNNNDKKRKINDEKRRIPFGQLLETKNENSEKEPKPIKFDLKPSKKILDEQKENL